MANHIHASAVIGADVELGNNVAIGPNTVLTGPVTISDDCWIAANVVIGGPPEIRGGPHAPNWDTASVHAGVVIGAGSIIREFTTINQGSERATSIGPGCYVMNKVHVGHDSVVEANVTLSVETILGGHVAIGEAANLGMGCIIHQRRVIGACAMVGMGSVVTRDVPPFALVHGSPCRIRSANSVGMQRQGFSAEAAAGLDDYYRRAVIPVDSDVPPELREQFADWRQEAARPLGGG